MTDVASGSVVAHDFGHYLRPLVRRKRVLAAFVLAGIVLAVAAYSVVRQTYTAGTKVLVNPPPAGQATTAVGGRTTGQVNLDTEAQIVKSSAVATIAKQTLKSPSSVPTLISRVTVAVPANSYVMRVLYTAHSTAVAKNGSQAFAQAYLTYRNQQYQGVIDDQLSKTDASLKTAFADLKEEQRIRKTAPPGSARKQEAGQKVQNLQTQINNLTVQQTTYQNTVVDAGTITSTANLVKAGTPVRDIAALACLVLGLLLGLVAVFLRERFDRTVRHSDDLLRMGIPLVAEVPAPPRGRRGRAPAARKRDADIRSRADQRAATAIATLLGDEGGTVYLASVSPEQARHRLADRLAKELGRFGSTVAVVRPTLKQPPPLRPSLTAGTVTDEAPLGWPGASTGTAASVPPDAETESAPVGPPDVQSAMRQVEDALRHARYVVIEGDAAAQESEAYILASLSQVSLLVVETGLTSRHALQEAADQVHVTSSTLVGAVLWSPPVDSDPIAPSIAAPVPPPSARPATSVARLSITAPDGEGEGPPPVDITP